MSTSPHMTQKSENIRSQISETNLHQSGQDHATTMATSIITYKMIKLRKLWAGLAYIRVNIWYQTPNLSDSTLRSDNKTIQKPLNKASDTLFKMLPMPFCQWWQMGLSKIWDNRLFSASQTQNTRLKDQYFSLIFLLMERAKWFWHYIEAKCLKLHAGAAVWSQGFLNLKISDLRFSTQLPIPQKILIPGAL
jgi:hypothetical protein